MYLTDIAHLELWVEDLSIAKAYEEVFGFNRIAEAGPETGLKGHRSVVLQQGTARLFLTASLTGSGPVSDFVAKHGDGVRDVAFRVTNATAAMQSALSLGAQPIDRPSVSQGEELRPHAIQAFGDVIHSFIDDPGTDRASLPRNYRRLDLSPKSSTGLFTSVDHLAICVEHGKMDDLADFYKTVLRFEDGHKESIDTGRSGMYARVVERGPIRFPLQEPLKPSSSDGPIGKFLRLNSGAGIYHIALQTDDIIATVRALRERGIHTLPTPKAFYDHLPGRVGHIQERVEDLRDLNVLVDGDRSGYLLQVFMPSLHKRNTLFVEVIQRRNARGFGSANIRALFDAVERAA